MRSLRLPELRGVLTRRPPRLPGFPTVEGRLPGWPPRVLGVTEGGAPGGRGRRNAEMIMGDWPVDATSP